MSDRQHSSSKHSSHKHHYRSPVRSHKSEDHPVPDDHYRTESVSDDHYRTESVARNSDTTCSEPKFPELWGTYLDDGMMAQMQAWRQEAEEHFSFSQLSKHSSRDNTGKASRKRERDPEPSQSAKRQKLSHHHHAMPTMIHINKHHPKFRRYFY